MKKNKPVHVHITQDQIDAIFKPHEDKMAAEQPLDEGYQAMIIVDLYKLVYPDGLWDKIDEIDGHPACGNETWEYICKKFIPLDKYYSTFLIRSGELGIFAGGAWMNKGFMADNQLDGTEIVQQAPYTLQEDAVTIPYT